MWRSALSILRVLALVLVAVTPALAQRNDAPPPPPEVLLQTWETQAETTERRIEERSLDFAAIDHLRSEIQAELVRMSALSQRLDSELAPLLSQRDALGPPPQDGETEAPELARERSRLATRIEELEGLKRRTDQAAARANAQINQLLKLKREVFTDELMNRGPSILEPGTFAAAVVSLGRGVAAIADETRDQIGNAAVSGDLIIRVGTPLLAMTVLLVAIGRIRRSIIGRLRARVGPEMSPSQRVIVAAGLTAARLIIPVLIVGVIFVTIASSELLGPLAEAVLASFFATALLVIGVYALGNAYFSPNEPALRLSTLSDRDARRARVWVIVLAAVAAFDRMLVIQSDAYGLAVEALTLVNTVLLSIGGVALWNLVGLVLGGFQIGEVETEAADDADDAPPEQSRDELMVVPVVMRVAGVFLRVVAIASPILALGGYSAASRYLFHPPVATAGLIGFFVLLSSVVRELVERVAAPAETTETGRNRLQLIPVTVAFLLSVVALPLIALIWGATTSDLLAVWHSLGEGFSVGDLRISPVEIISFLVVFAIGFAITRLLQGVLRRSVLPLTRLDTGGRAAVLAGVGYLGVLVSALIAISTAGIDLSNLAIVAGALSVGIGFGLQNIVNNFVSGVILLVERPIKAGDWIEIPSGMGYVRQINVRSTEIETFDRSSLIVPNSELIANTVTNYTHDNMQGRLIVKVGVAYGTDTRRVETLLLEIARNHPMVLRRPAPWIYFAGFDNSALQFEIRAILRDVNWLLNVRSDLNHEIARRFAEEGIEIPYPQRDLHLRDAGPIEGLLRPQKARRVPAPPGPRKGERPQHDDPDGEADGGADGR